MPEISKNLTECIQRREKDERVTNCDLLQRIKHASALPRAFMEQDVAIQLRKNRKLSGMGKKEHKKSEAF